MSCDNCQEQLLDYVTGELPAEEAATLESHVEECAACKASLAQLEVGQNFALQLPMAEPSPAISSALMAAAHAHVGSAPSVAAHEAPARGVDEEDSEGLWAAIMRWAGGFAMGPQVAMATIMLLVVSIGLWYFPNRRRSIDEATGSTVMAPDLGGEVGPSATLAPADPLDIDIDERTGRIRTRDEIDRERSNAARGAVIDARDQVLAFDSPGTSEEQSPAEGRLQQNQLAELDDSPRDGEGAPLPMRRAEAGSGASGDVDSLSALAADPRGLADDGRSVAGSSAYGAPVQAAPRSPASASPAPQGDNSNRGVEALPEAERQAAPGSATERYARAMREYQQGQYGAAAEDFDQVYRHPEGNQNLVPSSLHHLARSHQRANNCRVAVSQYRSLVSRFPSYDGTPRALIELATCYRTLGRLSDARATLEQAQRHASVAAEARRELIHVQQLERARQSRRRAVQADEAMAEPAAAY